MNRVFRRRTLRDLLGGVLGLAACSSALAAEGLAVPGGAALWPQFQARLSVSAAPLVPGGAVGLLPLAEPATPRTWAPSAALLGDLYLPAARYGLPPAFGGLRATSGLLLGTRAGGLAPPAEGASPGPFSVHSHAPVAPLGVNLGVNFGDALVPYVGVGYTGLQLGSFTVNADLGLVAEHPQSALQLPRAIFGTQGSDALWRDLRVSPVVRLGVNVRF
jgi:hypothetical protein